jgi:hypothetical protein
MIIMLRVVTTIRAPGINKWIMRLCNVRFSILLLCPGVHLEILVILLCSSVGDFRSIDCRQRLKCMASRVRPGHSIPPATYTWSVVFLYWIIRQPTPHTSPPWQLTVTRIGLRCSKPWVPNFQRSGTKRCEETQWIKHRVQGWLSIGMVQANSEPIWK